ncbi:MAG: tRNA threonylcarbamoyladenosine dehydratase [Akkermansiaceae bacterium]|nr:tRNA threonylcarbamoyladenosine dehydratase [Akkermansiaceae bacterium]
MTGNQKYSFPKVLDIESLNYRFGGIARLYGQAALDHFLKARVAVIGIGGVGSWAVESLARSGIGHLTLVDLDEICITNVNRQLHAMDGQIGRQKTEAMAERALAIHPGCDVQVVPKFFNEKSATEILDAGFDAIIDAIDYARHKSLLAAECHRRKIYMVTCGGAGGRRDPTRIRVTDLAFSGMDPLLLQLRRGLRNDFGFPKTPRGHEPILFGIDAVYSDEAPYYSSCDGTVSKQPPEEVIMRLNCASGFGSATHLIASFGMIAAGRVLENIAGKI